MEHDKHTKFEVNLKEGMIGFEQVTEENIFLSSSLDAHKSKVKEIGSGHLQSSSHARDASRNQIEDLYVPIMAHKNPTDLGRIDGSTLKPLEGDRFDDSVGLMDFKAHFEEAQKTMQKLDKAIEGMHSHSVNLSRSGGKVAGGAGVSKLIQAFESKVQHDDNGPEDLISPKGVILPIGERSTEDHFKLATDQTNILRAVLKELELSAEKVNQIFKDEQEGRKRASVALGEVQILYDGSKKQNSDLEVKIIEFAKRLSKYQSRADHLHSQLRTIEDSSDEMAALFSNKLESLHKDVDEKTSILEQGWNSAIGSISKTVAKLDASTRRPLTTTNPTVQSDALNVDFHLADSVNAASKLIEELHEKLVAADTSHRATLNSYESLNEKFTVLHVRNDLATGLLQMIYNKLRKCISGSCEDIRVSKMDAEDDRLLDVLQPISYMVLMEQLGELLGERLQLKSAKHELESNLISRTEEIKELNERSIDSKSILKLLDDTKTKFKVDEMEICSDRPPVSQLEYLIGSLLQKYREATAQVSLSKEEVGLKSMELSELKGEMHRLSSLNLQQEDEIHVLTENLREMEGNLDTLRSELQLKGTELEQSEHRTSSAREKLSIAVGKGKGLIVQRDNLKQSLSDVSTELERCMMELQLKESRLRDTETKLKTYSEAGERIEALESELSYIRNSATTLRESFLLKDSVIQRIEEILEDLELPDHFHARHIIEKIEWLAKSVASNPSQMSDWDQKSSVGGGSYSDGGFVVMDGWKEEGQSSSSPRLDDLKRKCEELQGKFCRLAEQNEMLEHSLIERDNLMQRWELVLDRIYMPSQLRSMEPEEKIGWLGKALYEAHHERDSLYMKIEDLESYCRSLRDDLEKPQRKISDLEVALQAIRHERDILSENLESLSHEHEKVSEKSIQHELENVGLQNEVTTLQEKLVEMLESRDYCHQVEGEIKRLHGLVIGALQDQSAEGIVFGGTYTERLEESLRKLIENYMTLSSEKPVGKNTVKEHHAEESDAVLVKPIHDETLNSMEQDEVVLKGKLEEALNNLTHLKEERDNILGKHQLLVVEFEALVRQRDDLQEKLSQEEQKYISTRDKLNVAVRKGKGLVQQRDSLKLTIEEVSTEVERVKIELNERENALVQYERKIKELSFYPEKVKALEQECSFSRSCLTELEHNLQNSEHSLSSLLNTLSAIDFGTGLNSIDPVNKLVEVGKLYHNLQAALASAEHETKKSKKATELLLEELNEVHERADGLQEELLQVAASLAVLSKERDVAEVARNEAVSRLEKVITVSAEERKSELAEVIKLTAGIDQLRKSCSGFHNLLTAVFFANKDLLCNVEAGMESHLRQMSGTDLVKLPLFSAPGGMFSNSAHEVKFPATSTLLEIVNQEHSSDSSIFDVFGILGFNLQECAREIDALREICQKNSFSSDQHAKSMSKIMEDVHREMISQQKSMESMKRDIAQLEFIRKEKDAEVLVLQKHLTLLSKACTESIFEIENQISQLIGNGSDFGAHVLVKIKGFKPPAGIEEPTSFSEEGIRYMAETLLLAVKDSANIQAEIVSGDQKELRDTILNLQKELQEKDIQRNRICAELVGQIQGAESCVKNYLVDLESAKDQVENLEKRLATVEKERNVLELRTQELQDREASSIQLQQKILTLTDSLNAKEQEIEDLMQALDEEESQIGGLTNRIEELEKILQEKNLAVENLEASRGRAMARFSTTVSKFDELHKLSQSLVCEVENLQSQLESRDADISFLRQEVTRCTNDVLAASQVNNKRNSSEMHDLLTWLDMMTSHFGRHAVPLDDKGCSRVELYKETLEKQIMSLISELEELRIMSQSKDALLQVERSRTQEMLHKLGNLENSLSEKNIYIASLQGAQSHCETTSMTSSEITEVEPMISKRGLLGAPVASHARSMRKLNSDQVAIGIDSGGSTLDEDDDKAHGFRSLTTSRIVPRFTRPVSDMIDGLWVSCDRALMRQPALRLGIILYWSILHALLATSMV